MEAFRRWYSGGSLYDIPEQSVIDTITHAFKGDSLTRIGTAFHRICQYGGDAPAETAEAGEREFTYYGKPKREAVPAGRVLEVDGHRIVFDGLQAAEAVRYHDSMPGAFHEVREYGEIEGYMITGCADVIDGTTVRDIKTKYSFGYSDSDYTDSMQWRLYLHLFGADVFRYDIFVFDGYNEARHGEDVRGLPLTRVTPPIECGRYAAMEDDIRRTLREMRAWLEYRGLTGFLKKTE